MSRPAVTIGQDKPVTDAVSLMIEKKVKRLPVVDAAGRLVGILSRVEVFRTSMRESPDWKAFQRAEITVENLRSISDIMRRDTPRFLPTPRSRK